MSDQDPQINPEELFDEDQTEPTSDAAEQVGIGTSSNNFELSKLRKPMTREPTTPAIRKDQPNIDNPTKKQPEAEPFPEEVPTESVAAQSGEEDIPF